MTHGSLRQSRRIYKRGGALHCPAPPCPSCQQRTVPA
nr:MAG TPA: deaminase [Caudoviricetes sp.]